MLLGVTSSLLPTNGEENWRVDLETAERNKTAGGSQADYDTAVNDGYNGNRRTVADSYVNSQALSNQSHDNAIADAMVIYTAAVASATTSVATNKSNSRETRVDTIASAESARDIAIAQITSDYLIAKANSFETDISALDGPNATPWASLANGEANAGQQMASSHNAAEFALSTAVANSSAQHKKDIQAARTGLTIANNINNESLLNSVAEATDDWMSAQRLADTLDTQTLGTRRFYGNGLGQPNAQTQNNKSATIPPSRSPSLPATPLRLDLDFNKPLSDFKVSEITKEEPNFSDDSVKTDRYTIDKSSLIATKAKSNAQRSLRYRVVIDPPRLARINPNSCVCHKESVSPRSILAPGLRNLMVVSAEQDYMLKMSAIAAGIRDIMTRQRVFTKAEIDKLVKSDALQHVPNTDSYLLKLPNGSTIVLARSFNIWHKHPVVLTAAVDFTRATGELTYRVLTAPIETVEFAASGVEILSGKSLHDGPAVFWSFAVLLEPGVTPTADNISKRFKHFQDEQSYKALISRIRTAVHIVPGGPLADYLATGYGGDDLFELMLITLGDFTMVGGKLVKLTKAVQLNKTSRLANSIHAADVVVNGTLVGKHLLYDIPEAVETGQTSKATMLSLGAVIRTTSVAFSANDLAKAARKARYARAHRVAGEIGLQTTCFAAGTPVLTPAGPRPIESLKAGDLVLSRSEFDPTGDVGPRRIEEVFQGDGAIVEVSLNGRTIECTEEHPFYVVGSGWVKARDLEAGQQIVGHDSQTATVDSVHFTSQTKSVYNFRVATDHTYFVGGDDWGFSAWVHNTCHIILEEAGEWVVRDVTDWPKNLDVKNAPVVGRSASLDDAIRLSLGKAATLDELNAIAKSLVDNSGGAISREAVDLLAGEANHLVPRVLSEADLLDFRTRLINSKTAVLEPNARYMTPEGTVYHADAQGRLARIEFTLNGAGDVKAAGAARTARSTDTTPLGEPLSGITGDVGFHARADAARGIATFPNIFPGSGKLNNGAFKSIELYYTRAARSGTKVDVVVEGIFGPGSTAIRPSHIKIEVTRNGRVFAKIFPNNASAVLSRAEKNTLKALLGL